MRARGAQATDIAVLVVAADDGVMPQTIESIKHAKAAGVPIIVAINKMDKPSANPTRVRTELLQHEVFVESMGGDALDVEVSAVTKAGLDKLLETILLQAEVLELQVPRDGRAEGLVIEAKLDRGRGAVATVLVQRGTLSVGDIVVAGTEFARVRALIDDKGEQVKEAGPSTPGRSAGLYRRAQCRRPLLGRRERSPRPRDHRLSSAPAAREVGRRRCHQPRADDESAQGRRHLQVPADHQGRRAGLGRSDQRLAQQALDRGSLGADPDERRRCHHRIRRDAGLGLERHHHRLQRPRQQAGDATSRTRDGIEIRYYNIIYDLVDDVKAAMSGLLKPERRETFIGYAEILEVFHITKVGKVAGCRVTEGIVERGAGVRLLRDNVVIHEGKLKTLKRFKDEVKEVPTGQECGMAFENYEDIRAGDVIECFRVESITRTL